MKTSGAKSAFTLVELLVVIFVVAILVAILLPALTRSPAKSGRGIQCVANQKQIALALIIFQGDYAGKYPWQDSATNGGSFESISSGQAFPHFQILSPYLRTQPNILICFSDKTRHAATNYSKLQNENISYFLNLDATTNNPSFTILTGDRYLAVKSKPVNPGLFNYSTNMTLNWASGFHRNAHNEPWGGFSFADGHVQFVGSDDLNSLLQKQPLATNRFCIP